MNIHRTWDADKFARIKDETKLIEYFITNYIVPLSQEYAERLIAAMERAAVRVLTPQELSSLSMKVTSYTLGYRESYMALVTKFLKSVHLPFMKNILGITSPGVLKAIEKRTLKQFKNNIEGAFMRTPLDVRNAVKELQGELSRMNKILKRAKADGMLNTDYEKLSADLAAKMRKNCPDYFRMTEDKQFVRYRDGKLVKVETYSDMATRTELLNVERDAVEVRDAVKQRRVVEFYLRDTRTLKGDSRESCRHVMARKWYGKSIVAYDRAAADLFGIPTVEDIRANGSFGPNCRHSLRSLEKADYNRIDQLLYLAETEIA